MSPFFPPFLSVERCPLPLTFRWSAQTQQRTLAHILWVSEQSERKVLLPCPLARLPTKLSKKRRSIKVTVFTILRQAFFSLAVFMNKLMLFICTERHQMAIRTFWNGFSITIKIFWCTLHIFYVFMYYVWCLLKHNYDQLNIFRKIVCYINITGRLILRKLQAFGTTFGFPFFV